MSNERNQFRIEVNDHTHLSEIRTYGDRLSVRFCQRVRRLRPNQLVQRIVEESSADEIQSVIVATKLNISCAAIRLQHDVTIGLHIAIAYNFVCRRKANFNIDAVVCRQAKV